MAVSNKASTTMLNSLTKMSKIANLQIHDLKLNEIRKILNICRCLASVKLTAPIHCHIMI